jgi:hypothetical protein
VIVAAGAVESAEMFEKMVNSEGIGASAFD